MPAGVPMKEYLSFMAAAMLAMFAGSQVVHRYYNPLKDLNHYIEREIKEQRLKEVTEPQNAGDSSSRIKM